MQIIFGNFYVLLMLRVSYFVSLISGRGGVHALSFVSDAKLSEYHVYHYSPVAICVIAQKKQQFFLTFSVTGRVTRQKQTKLLLFCLNRLFCTGQMLLGLKSKNMFYPFN